MSLSSAYDNDDLIVEGADAPKLFITPQWQGQIQQIIHLAEFTGDIQVVQGDNGSGKTTLINILKDKLPGEEYVGCVTASEDVMADVALSQLLECLGLSTVPGQQRGKSIVELRKYVQQLHSNNLRRIIIIDDAHFLDDTILGSVASVMQGSSDQSFGLHLILFSQLGVAERFDGLGFIDISVHDIEMIPFSLKETSQFLELVEPRLLSSQLDISQINHIWTSSKGLPGEILNRARSAVNDRVGGRSGSNGIPWFHMIAVVILVSILGSFAYYKGHDFSEFNVILNSFKSMFSDAKGQKPIANEGLELAQATAKDVNVDEIGADEIKLDNAINDSADLSLRKKGQSQIIISGNENETASEGQDQLPLEHSGANVVGKGEGGAKAGEQQKGLSSAGREGELRANQELVSDSQIDTDSDLLVIEASDSLSRVADEANTAGSSFSDRKIDKVPYGENLPASGSELLSDNRTNEDSKAPSTEMQKNISTEQDGSHLKEEVAVAVQVELLASELSVDEDEPTLEAFALPVAGAQATADLTVEADALDRLSSVEVFVRHSEERLLALDPNGFVLQVLATKPETPLLQYLKDQSNNTELMMYRGLRRGKHWFVVVEGFYKTKDQALAAIPGLPQEQVNAGPWSKQVKAVQFEIKASRQQ